MKDKKRFRVIVNYRQNARSNLITASYRYFDTKQSTERCILKSLNDRRTFNIMLAVHQPYRDLWYGEKSYYHVVGKLGGFTTARSSAQAIARCLHSAAIAERYHLQPNEWQ